MSSPTIIVIVVGDLDGVIAGTKWDPGPLTEALLKADRILHPGKVEYDFSLGAVISVIPRWLKQASLPRGRNLAQMMPPDQFQRLVRLERRGILKKGFDRKHPFHLAVGLFDHAVGKSGLGPDISDYVKRAAKKHRLNMVPVPKVGVKAIFNNLFATQPESHVQCLLDMAALAEMGSSLMKERSEAWAARRVPQLLASPAEQVYGSCWPSHLDEAARPGQRDTILRLLSEPKVTVAVMDIRSLAIGGGILDQLAARGLKIEGPKWKN
ncbi:MAG: TraB/GumN family protein [Sphingosinicella sp.]|nr:TraB/GumN family protein [Sphingosinicella sp.]